jgi:hypothetical protein
VKTLAIQGEIPKVHAGRETSRPALPVANQPVGVDLNPLRQQDARAATDDHGRIVLKEDVEHVAEVPGVVALVRVVAENERL